MKAEKKMLNAHNEIMSANVKLEVGRKECRNIAVS
jgi:hypothetical protein